MSLDFGSEFLKIGLVKPGVPMEIVLNRESHRKSPNVLHLRGNERFFGEGALALETRFPQHTYNHLLDLLGKSFDHPLVQRYQERYSLLNLVPDPDRNTVAFKLDDQTYTIEELVAMIISDCRYLAEKSAEQPVKDAVITVPVYFNQAERRAMTVAADIAGVNLLQLINDNTAVAINYGMFRRKEFNESAQTLLVYDMGSTQTTVSVLEYKVVKDKVTKEKNPEVSVMGVGYDRTLGGVEFTLRLRNHLAQIFQNQGKVKAVVKDTPKAMAKLLKEANRVKQVLSANIDHYAQVENLMENLDFKAKVSRDELEELGKDLFERVASPIQDALRMSELNVNQVDQIVLMGGATRMPKVQELIQKALDGQYLGKFLNTDESAALGAVYQAAHLSKGFKVKKFLIQELNLFPIRVDFSKENSTDSQGKSRIIQRILYGYKSSFPHKKLMSFSKTHDFDLNVNYGDLSHFSTLKRDHIGAVNVSRVEVIGVTDAINSHVSSEKTVFKTVKVHFKMDESGVFTVDSAEAIFEKTTGEGGDEEQSTFQKLGSKISSFFGGGDDNKETSSPTDNSDKQDKDTEKTTDSSQTPKKDEKINQKPKSKEKEAKTEPETNTTTTTASNTTDDVNGTSSSNATTDKPKKQEPKIEVIKEKLKLNKVFVDIPGSTVDSVKLSKKKLKVVADIEAARLKREDIMNTLESFMIDVKIKLEEDEFSMLVTDADKDAIMTKVNDVSTWFEDESGFETTTKEFEDKLKILKDATNDLFYKHDEGKNRQKAVDAMNGILNHSSIMFTAMKSLPNDSQIYSETELSTFEKLINSTQTWWDEKEIEQAKLKSSDTPTITLAGVGEKISALDREIKYLLNKAKFAKPKPKPASNTTASNDTTSKNNATKIDLGDAKAEKIVEPDSESSTEAPKSAEPPSATPEGYKKEGDDLPDDTKETEIGEDDETDTTHNPEL